MSEGCVQADRRAHDAEAIRPEQSHAVTPCALDHVAFERCAFGADFAETRGDDDGSLDARAAALFDDFSNIWGRCCDYREIDLFGQIRDRPIATHAEHPRVLRIHAE